MFQVHHGKHPGRQRLSVSEWRARKHEKAVARASRRGEHAMHLLGGLGRWGGGGGQFRRFKVPGSIPGMHQAKSLFKTFRGKQSHRTTRTAEAQTAKITQLQEKLAHLQASGAPANQIARTQKILAKVQGWHIASITPPLLGDTTGFLGKSLLKKLRKKVSAAVPKPLKKVISVFNPLKSPLSPISYISKTITKSKKTAAKKKAAKAYNAPYAAIAAAQAKRLEEFKQKQAQLRADREVKRQAMQAQKEAEWEQRQADLQTQQEQQAQDALIKQQQADFEAQMNQMQVSTPEMPYMPAAPTPTMLPPTTAYQYAPAPVQAPYAQPAPIQQQYAQPTPIWDTSQEIYDQMPSDLPGDYQDEGQFPDESEANDIMSQDQYDDGSYDDWGYDNEYSMEGLGALPKKATNVLLLAGVGVTAYLLFKKKRR